MEHRIKGLSRHPRARFEHINAASAVAVCISAVCTLAVPGRSMAQSMKKNVMENVTRATVLVLTQSSQETRGDTTLGTGSGFFINGTGVAITNNHVVDPSHAKTPIEQHRFHYSAGKLTYTVVVNSGTEDQQEYDAEVLYQNRAADQAILQVYDENGDRLNSDSYLRIQPESRLSKRMKVWAIGFPGGDTQRRQRDDGHPSVTVTSGHTSRVPRTPGGRIRMIYTDVEVRPGNSGGPVVDQDGFLVGTATLMSFPEGYDFTGGAKYSALVPAKLTGQMVRNAFDLRKMKNGTDVTPFMDVLTDEHGHITVPEFKRLPDSDMLFFDDGDRIHGKITAATIEWDSKIGTLEIPTDAIAYVMNSSDGAHLFLEGGNHIYASSVNASFAFAPRTGAVIKQRFDDVGTVAFRQSDRHLQDVSGEVLILDTNVCHLILSDVKGKARFRSRAGTLDVALRDVERIDTGTLRKKIILFTDGSRLTGTFEESQFTGVIAATGTSITFDLNDIDFCTVEIVDIGGSGIAGLDLPGVLAAADRPLRRIARGLQSPDVSKARAELDKWLMPDRFKRLPLGDKEQIRLLEAVALLRGGKYAESARAFRKSIRAKDENIAAFAQACVDVLKEYDRNQYGGKPLSSNTVFAKAGVALASSLISEARDYLKSAELQEGTTRGEYTKYIARVRKLETAMTTTAVFRGEVADDELIRLWKSSARASVREISRLDALKEQKRDQKQRRNNRGGSRSSARRRSRTIGGISAYERELKSLDEQRSETVETLREYVLKLYEYGFRIEDPDVQELKERQREYEMEIAP